jgi:hypothetical protein
LGRYSMSMGRGNAVMRDGQGVNYGASDPIGDGEAIPQSAPWHVPSAGKTARRSKGAQ